MLRRMTQRHGTRTAAPVQRISGPEELLAAVPYLVGFHPQDSLVLVGLRNRRVQVTARLDLADAVPGGIAYTLAAMSRGGVTSVIAVIYADDMEIDEETDPRPWDVLACIEEQTALRGCRWDDVLLVAAQRWWSLTCTAQECCPPEGRELPSAPTAFTAAATYDGMVVLPDRTALEALLDPVPEAERAALAAALEAAERAAVQETLQAGGDRYARSVKRALFAAARAADRPRWTGLADAELARFGAALRVIAIRDAAWIAIEDRRIDGRPLWRELARRLPAHYACPPLFLYGWAAWRDGNGALAGIAAERAVCTDPDYSASYLLLAAVRDAVDPRRIRRLRMPRSA
jgi:hypothetical protein